MAELVPEQPIAVLRPRAKLARAKVDVVADGKRARTQLRCSGGGVLPGMNTSPTDSLAEVRGQPRLGRWIEGGPTAFRNLRRPGLLPLRLALNPSPTNGGSQDAVAVRRYAFVSD